MKPPQKLLCIHMAEFKVTIEAVWEKDGEFEDLGDGRLLKENNNETEGKEADEKDDEKDEDMDDDDDDDDE